MNIKEEVAKRIFIEEEAEAICKIFDEAKPKYDKLTTDEERIKFVEDLRMELSKRFKDEDIMKFSSEFVKTLVENKKKKKYTDAYQINNIEVFCEAFDKYLD